VAAAQAAAAIALPMNSHMQACYHLVGVSGKIAPITIRERLAIPEPRLAEALRHLSARPGIAESIILCTASRTEVLVAAKGEGSEPRRFLDKLGEFPAGELSPYLYEHRERSAVRHLFRVTAGLDDAPLRGTGGLRLIRHACTVARAEGTLGRRLGLLTDHAFSAARRVRKETWMGTSSVSVAAVVNELANRIAGSISGLKICLVGDGGFAEDAARQLLARGAGELFVVSWHHGEPTSLAARLGLREFRPEELYEVCHLADIVITCVGAQSPLFRRAHGEAFLAHRRNRPMIFADLALPRDVHPEMGALDGIFVFNIDDIQEIASRQLSPLNEGIQEAEAIIDEEVDRFHARLNAASVVPAIISLRRHLESIRQHEMRRLAKRLALLSAEQRSVLDDMTLRMVNKVAHSSSTTLRAMGDLPGSAAQVAMVARIFGLPAQSEFREETDGMAA
jgi:glutamyl-tRNA reductase